MAVRYVFVLILSVAYTQAQTGPNFCSYNDGVFECDYASMVSTSDRPIDFNGFSQDPQQIEITVNGFLPYFGDTKVFTNFDSIDKTTFDNNYPSTLTIDCGFGGSMFMTAGAFNNMSHVQYLKIRNCDTYYIPSQMFTELNNLDFFSFEGGSIDDIDPNGMFGLSVEKMTFDSHTIPRNMGKFDLKYTPFSTKSVPPGLLFNWKNLSTVALVGADLETISADVFTFNSKLTHIDLSDNTFVSIPSGIFDNLNSLSGVDIYNIQWTCSCDNTWFVDYSAKNNISMSGDYMCSNVAGMSVWKYYEDNCRIANLCDGTIGIVLLKKCLTLFGMLAFGCAFLALVIAIVCLGLIICMRKQSGQTKNRQAKARGRWNKVKDIGRLKLNLKK
ncbi:leucine-rich repeat transmembrane protein FLRT3-like isoform X2 [Ruditapes philippinarum]|uniref:leucine-rich repeat transmembrane protein FLRT3-like isoform X2 n=1 Tax=Ruditapes philippinarum TaxID=129788 RepID=UPI00295AA141|nr:leucine-rich repeat transmembrane protein FLRT3-like isoform X2 [Ruditapes philippinarum]